MPERHLPQETRYEIGPLMTFGLFLLNEAMAFLTLLIVFPGFLPPKDGMEWFMVAMLAIPMSVVWWLFLAVSPIAFGAMWLWDDLTFDYWRSAWPLNKL